MINNLLHSFRSIWIPFVLILMDQLSKSYIKSYNFEISVTLLDIRLVWNYGMILGSFEDLTPVIRIVFVSVLGLYLNILIVLVLYFFKHKKIKRLSYGMVLFISGVDGNLLDRLFYGKIVDFISVIGFKGVYFNLADIFLMAGLMLIILSLFLDIDKIWYQNEKRQSYLISPHYQWPLSLIIGASAFLNLIIMFLFSFALVQQYLSPHEKFMRIYLLGMYLIVMLGTIIPIIFGIIYSHRIVGPIKAFISHLNKPESEINKFKLRQNDYFKELEDVANIKKTHPRQDQKEP